MDNNIYIYYSSEYVASTFATMAPNFEVAVFAASVSAIWRAYDFTPNHAKGTYRPGFGNTQSGPAFPFHLNLKRASHSKTI